MAATLPLTMWRNPRSLSLRVKVRNGSGAGMEEYLLHSLLHLIFAPIRMLHTECRSLEISGAPIEGKGSLPFLLAAGVAQGGNIFRRELGCHGLMIQEAASSAKESSC